MTSFDLPPGKTQSPKPRTLTVSYSVRDLPRIVLCGTWLSEWGFNLTDPLTAVYAGSTSMLLKPGPVSENEAFAFSRLNKLMPDYSPADAKKYRPHPTAVSYPSDRRVPQITVTGAWLHDWNITVGDRICVTRTDDGQIYIKVDMAAAQLREIKEKKKLEQEAAGSIAMLEHHKTTHPHLYEQAPEGPAKHMRRLKSRKTDSQVTSISADYFVTLIGPDARLPVAG